MNYISKVFVAMTTLKNVTAFNKGHLEWLKKLTSLIL